MNQDELIKNFLTQQTAGWLTEDIPIMQEAFLANKTPIIESFQTSIRKLCLKASSQQIAGNKGPAAHLYISFLRTNILEDNWQYRLDLYDEKFYLDSTECSTNWEIDFVWKYLKARLTQLSTTMKNSMYANKMQECHLNQVKVEMAAQYHQIAMACTKLIIEEALGVPEYRELAKTQNFKIAMGEYLDNNMLLYEEQPPQEEKSEE